MLPLFALVTALAVPAWPSIPAPSCLGVGSSLADRATFAAALQNDDAAKLALAARRLAGDYGRCADVARSEASPLSAGSWSVLEARASLTAASAALRLGDHPGARAALSDARAALLGATLVCAPSVAGGRIGPPSCPELMTERERLLAAIAEALESRTTETDSAA